MSSAAKKMLMAASGEKEGWILTDFTFSGSAANRWPQGRGTSTLYPSLDESDVLFWKPDGTKIFIFQSMNSSPAVQAYNLSTAFDLSTAGTTQSASFSVNSQESFATGLYFKSDGTAFFVSGLISDKVHKYTMSTAWDISSASYSQSTSTLNDSSVEGLWFKSDGTKFYFCGNNARDVREYNLSTAWDLSTASASTTYDDGQGGYFKGLAFNAAGTKLYRTSGGVWHESSLSTAWSLSTASYNDTTTPSTPQTMRNVEWTNSGNTMWLATGEGTVDKYSASTAYDFSTATWVAPSSDYFSLEGTLSGNPDGFYMKPDGTSFFVLDGGNYNHYLRRYDMSTAFDLTTASLAQTSADISSTTFNGYDGIYFRPNGLRFYGTIGSKIYSRNLSTAWDLSTISSSSTNKTITSTAKGLYFKPDGTSFFYVRNNQYIYKYNMSTAWDISTASYSQSSYLVSKHPTVPTIYNVEFSDDGTKMYCPFERSQIGGALYVAYYELSTAWSLSSVTRSASMNFGTFNTTLRTIRFNPDGSEAFLLGRQAPQSIGKITN